MNLKRHFFGKHDKIIYYGNIFANEIKLYETISQYIVYIKLRAGWLFNFFFG